MFRVLTAAALILSLQLLAAPNAGADVLDFIKASKSLVVGVKADYPPFGYRDKSGAIVGFEPDLAADVARRLGVELELVPVTSGARIPNLQTGKVDLIIATLTDLPERRQQVQYIEPLYYADFVNILLRRDAAIMKWEELKGKTVCGTSGGYHKAVAEKYSMQLVLHDGSDKALAALDSGACLGYIFDQSWIIGRLANRKWHVSFDMPLPGVMEAPWGMAVRKDEERFRKVMNGIAADWAKSGFILEMEQKWHIPPSLYAMRMHDQFLGK
jgi:polar amino acid transport system substrate-binding protein